MPSANHADTIAIVGGVYHEKCIWPEWDQVYGSAGRAAAALQGHVRNVFLYCYGNAEIKKRISSVAKLYNFRPYITDVIQAVSFEYVHSLSVPVIRPSLNLISPNSPIVIKEKTILRFGMMEGSAITESEWCIYDPQSAFEPEPFFQNGSKTSHLAIVGNRSEIRSLGNHESLPKAAEKLLSEGAEVIVVKGGATGADVYNKDGSHHVPAYQTTSVWTIGSGDVFAAIFAAAWGIEHLPPAEAADLASRAVADYVESVGGLPITTLEELKKKKRADLKSYEGRVYLAGPFFTLGQRWLIDETRSNLAELGLDVFSPIHDIGPGPADKVAPADIEEIKKCDVMFALIDGLDSGTIFEIGYARALDKPVYVLSQAVPGEDLKMIVGSGCKVYSDYVTALHHLAWRI